MIETEFLGGTNLRFCQDTMVHSVFAILGANAIGGEHHGDGHTRQVVHWPAFDHRQHAITAGHGEPPPPQ